MRAWRGKDGGLREEGGSILFNADLLIYIYFLVCLFIQYLEILGSIKCSGSSPVQSSLGCVYWQTTTIHFLKNFKIFFSIKTYSRGAGEVPAKSKKNFVIRISNCIKNINKIIFPHCIIKMFYSQGIQFFCKR